MRWMACLAAAEALLLFTVLLWPVPADKDTYQDITYSDNEIAMEEVTVTTQRSTPPPPPRPQVPIPVPDDKIIEEKIIELEKLDLTQLDEPLAMEGVGTSGNSNRITANPQTPPNVIRIVEPTVPAAAKKEKVKAEIWVSFLVNREGKVEEATISQIRIYDPDENDFVEAQSIEYGLTEATLEAALQWKFRPAQEDGNPVRAYSEHIFTYGY